MDLFISQSTRGKKVNRVHIVVDGKYGKKSLCSLGPIIINGQIFSGDESQVDCPKCIVKLTKGNK